MFNFFKIKPKREFNLLEKRLYKIIENCKKIDCSNIIKYSNDKILLYYCGCDTKFKVETRLGERKIEINKEKDYMLLKYYAITSCKSIFGQEMRRKIFTIKICVNGFEITPNLALEENISAKDIDLALLEVETILEKAVEKHEKYTKLHEEQVGSLL